MSWWRNLLSDDVWPIRLLPVLGGTACLYMVCKQICWYFVDLWKHNSLCVSLLMSFFPIAGHQCVVKCYKPMIRGRPNFVFFFSVPRKPCYLFFGILFFDRKRYRFFRFFWCKNGRKNENGTVAESIHGGWPDSQFTPANADCLHQRVEGILCNAWHLQIKIVTTVRFV